MTTSYSYKKRTKYQKDTWPPPTKKRRNKKRNRKKKSISVNSMSNVEKERFETDGYKRLKKPKALNLETGRFVPKSYETTSFKKLKMKEVEIEKDNAITTDELREDELRNLRVENSKLKKDNGNMKNEMSRRGTAFENVLNKKEKSHKEIMAAVEVAHKKQMQEQKRKLLELQKKEKSIEAQRILELEMQIEKMGQENKETMSQRVEFLEKFVLKISEKL